MGAGDVARPGGELHAGGRLLSDRLSLGHALLLVVAADARREFRLVEVRTRKLRDEFHGYANLNLLVGRPFNHRAHSAP